MWEFSEVKLIFFVSTFVKRIIDPRLLPPVRIQPWQNTCMHLPQTIQRLCHNLDHHVYKEVATSLNRSPNFLPPRSPIIFTFAFVVVFIILLFFTNTFSLFTFFPNYFHLYHRLFSFVQANHPSTFSPGNNYEHEAFGDITGTSQTTNFLFFHFYFFFY